MKKILLSAFFLSIVIAGKSQGPFGTTESIDINYIKAGQFVHGDMWGDAGNYEPACEFPQGTGKNIGFISNIWLAGIDQSSNLRISATTDRSSGADFWPGPYNNVMLTTYIDSKNWARIWKINKKTIDSFRMQTNHTVNNTPATILEWPAKGNALAKGNNNVSLQITKDMAPFIDVNNDGMYNALDGDYPAIKGDQMLWWVINDNGPVHNSMGAGMGLNLELQCSAYAYKTLISATSILNYVVYYEYKIVNYLNQKYDSAMLAINSIAQIGCAFDDYVGFDSTYRMAIIYNGNTVDGTGQTNCYGNTPPIAGVSFVRLPGDNSSGFSPAKSFMVYDNNWSPYGNPFSVSDCYNYMNSTFRNGQHLVRDWDGVSGHPSYGRTTGPSANYLFDGDPVHSNEWSECICNNIPGDRRYVLTSNAFTIMPYSSNKIAMALIATPRQNSGCPNTSFSTIKDMADDAWYFYYHPLYPLEINDVTVSEEKLTIYPNPATNTVFIKRPLRSSDLGEVFVYDAIGKSIAITPLYKNDLIELDVKNLPLGLYTILYKSNGGQQSGVFMKE